nr:type I polyketide synthase [Streptomyces sp. SID13726]
MGALAESLGVDEDLPLREALPAIEAWQRRRRDEAAVAPWRYRVTWQPTEGDRSRGAEPEGTWLVVLPSRDAGAAVAAADALAQVAPLVRLTPGTEQTLDRDTLAGLLRDAVTDAGPIAGVLSLLALDEGPEQEFDDRVPQLSTGLDDRVPHLSTGLAGTLVLLQALGDAQVRAPLWCATRGAVAISPAERLESVAQAEVWGLGRVAALEHPDRWGGLVDLPEVMDERVARHFRTALAGVPGGVPGAEGTEDQLAVRASGLFVRRLERAPLTDRPPVRAWRPTGTILVTGATGAVGRHLARWLAAEGADHLLLTSRRAPGAPELAALQRDIAAAGTRVTFAQCDVADRHALAELVERTRADGHQITAVVHAAALIELAALDQATPDDLARSLAAKATAADHLDELFDDDSLDAFVLFSSIAGVWGSGDHGAYAAGNAHLDALAQRRRARGRTALSVAWGVWDGCLPEGLEVRPDLHGLPAITPGLACTALRQALDHDETHIAVAEVDWERFTAAFTSARPRPLLAGVTDVHRLLDPAAAEATTGAPRTTAVADALSALRGRLADRTATEQHTILLDLVRQHTAAVLGHRGDTESIRSDRAFRDLGVDSLTSVELRNRLAAATGLRLPTALVFSHPNAPALARHLATLIVGERSPSDTPAAATDGARRHGTGSTDDEPIAIIGMACRYPGGVGSPEDLWDLVAAGGDAVSGLPANRGWDLAGMYHPDPDREGTCYTREGGFLHDAGEFDPAFFGISPREALTMDPQQRLLLETSWEALERAHIDPTRMRGTSTGVFVGINYQDYGTGARDLPHGGEGHLLTGTVPSVASGRIAYALGLEGPAITLDTACSSSLVALHLAAQALRRGECDTALAGGAAVMYTPRTLIGFSRQRGLATDGRCKAFSDSADGMGMAEGVGMLLVERLSDARRNGHPVLAVLRASAINQDGASNGLSAPSGPAQERVIRAALASAGLSTRDVDVVEAHGTGTPLGDPIEADALLATYGQDRDPLRPLWLGSVKSNIGHAQAAAGVAGVIKMVMALRHGLLPRTLHVDGPSSHVDWSAGAVELLTEARSWPEADRVRRAGVSSFGISGTNAHVIVEQAQDEPTPTAAAISPVADLGGLVAWVVSARGTDALADQAKRLAELAETEADAESVATALVSGRALLGDRAVVFGRNAVELGVAARALADGVDHARVVSGGESGSGVVFVFPGQGAQWVGMGRELLACSAVFAASIAECEAALAPYVDWSLSEVLDQGSGLDQVDVVQPVLWAVMVSLAALWRSVGVEPAAVVGHSQGEIAAACVAGALTLDEGARVVALRSKAIRRLAGTGGMVSVFAGAERVESLLVDGVGIAAVNGSASVVVSGEAGALDVFLAACAEAGVEARRVAVDYASHSVMVEALEEEITTALAGVTSLAPDVPMLSTFTGEWVKAGDLDGGYWYGNLRHRVRLADAVAELASDGRALFVEVSPHPVLVSAVQDGLDEQGGGMALGTLRRDQGGAERLLRSLAEAFVQGASVDWRALLPVGSTAHVDLPTYAFQRSRYWLEPAQNHSDGDGWRYRVTWDEAEALDGEELSGSWLLVCPEQGEGLAGECAAALAEAGADVTLRAMPTADASPESYAELFREVGPVAGVLSLLALDTAPGETDGVPRGLAATLALVQALAAERSGTRLWLATAGAVYTGAGDTAQGDPEQARLWAMGRAFGLESPESWGGLIDLPVTLDEVSGRRLAGVLAGTLGAEDQLALRSGGVLVRRMVRAPRTASRMAPRTAAAESWRPHGTVLITGGTGGIGGQVARRLVREGVGRLVLTSRRGLDAPGARELAGELAELGAEVVVEACDAADREALEALVDRVEKEGDPITAVFHAAGIADTVPLTATESAHLAAAHRAKGLGLLNLEEVLGDRLEALVLFSSGAAVWGSAGLAAYGAANAFLDAFAEQRRRTTGLPVTSIAWGLWGEVGMGQGESAEELARRGVRPMEPERAVTLMLEAVAAGETTLTVADIDWEVFHAAFASSRRRPLVEDIDEVRRLLSVQWDTGAPTGDSGTVGARPDLPARLAAMPSGERERALARLVREQAATVLGLESPEAVPPARAFRELGFDSMMAVDIRGRLARATGLKLPATLVFDHPTPAALAAYLLARLLPESAADRMPAGSPVDERIRRLLAAVPEERLDEAADRMEAALRALLAGEDTPQTADDAEDIDDMDAASLVRMAMNTAD